MELGLNSHPLPPECVLPTTTPQILMEDGPLETTELQELKNWRNQRGHNGTGEPLPLRHPSKYSRMRNTHVLFCKISAEYCSLFKGTVKLRLEVRQNKRCCQGENWFFQNGFKNCDSLSSQTEKGNNMKLKKTEREISILKEKWLLRSKPLDT